MSDSRMGLLLGSQDGILVVEQLAARGA